MKRLSIITLTLMLLVPCVSEAADWYVRPITGEYEGGEDGSSYANAFDGFSGITWGVGGVVAGDTLYVCGTFREVLAVGASGTSDSARITIRKHPDYDAIIYGTLDYDSASWTQVGASNIWRTADGSFTDIMAMLVYNFNTTPVFGIQEDAFADLDTNWEFWWDDDDSEDSDGVDDAVYVYHSGGAPNTQADGLELANPAVNATTGVITLRGDDYITLQDLTVQFSHFIGIDNFESADNNIIDGCTVAYHGGRYNNAGNCIQIQHTSSNIIVRNCTVHDSWDIGISIEMESESGDISGILVDGNTVYNCPSVGIYVGDQTADDTYAIDDVTISNNTVHSNAGSTYVGKITVNTTTNKWPFLIGASCSTSSNDNTTNLVVENNHLYNVEVDTVSGAETASAILLRKTDAIIRYNIIHDIEATSATFPLSTKGIYTLCGETGTFAGCDNDLQAYYNVLYDIGDNGIVANALSTMNSAGTITVYNNTIECDGDQTYYDSPIWIGNYTTAVTAKNNICYSATSRGMFVSTLVISDPVLDYNLYYANTHAVYYKGTGYSTATALHAAVPAQEAHGVDGDPLFVSASDYHLTSSSPAINVGDATLGLTTDYDGRTVPYGVGVDIGAYEWVRRALILQSE